MTIAGMLAAPLRTEHVVNKRVHILNPALWVEEFVDLWHRETREHAQSTVVAEHAL
jgi:hypothetical protein